MNSRGVKKEILHKPASDYTKIFTELTLHLKTQPPLELFKRSHWEATRSEHETYPVT